MTDLRPLAAALAAVAVLAHKAPADAGLSGPAFVLRDLVMRYGWFVLYVVASQPELDTVIGIYAVFLAPGLLLAAAGVVNRAPRGKRAAAARRIAQGVLRYGWIAAAPFLLVAIESRETARLAAGGVWLLSGVAVTVVALIPLAWRDALRRPA